MASSPSSSDGLPRGLIHGDLFRDNLLLDSVLSAPDAPPTLIGFEEAADHVLLADIGMAVVGIGMGLGERDQIFDPAAARAFLVGYQAVRPLEPLERERLNAWAGYAALCVCCWRLWNFHVHRPGRVAMETHGIMGQVGGELWRGEHALL